MQLTVETIALVIFQRVRELEVEPVLTELMPYYERDEARHVGLGVQLVPQMMNDAVESRGSSRSALFQLDMLVDDAHRAQDDRAGPDAARGRPAQHAGHRVPQAGATSTRPSRRSFRSGPRTRRCVASSRGSARCSSRARAPDARVPLATRVAHALAGRGARARPSVVEQWGLAGQSAARGACRLR